MNVKTPTTDKEKLECLAKHSSYGTIGAYVRYIEKHDICFYCDLIFSLGDIDNLRELTADVWNSDRYTHTGQRFVPEAPVRTLDSLIEKQETETITTFIDEITTGKMKPFIQDYINSRRQRIMEGETVDKEGNFFYSDK